jgi:hypothetical protein
MYGGGVADDPAKRGGAAAGANYARPHAHEVRLYIGNLGLHAGSDASIGVGTSRKLEPVRSTE